MAKTITETKPETPVELCSQGNNKNSTDCATKASQLSPRTDVTPIDVIAAVDQSKINSKLFTKKGDSPSQQKNHTL